MANPSCKLTEDSSELLCTLGQGSIYSFSVLKGDLLLILVAFPNEKSRLISCAHPESLDITRNALGFLTSCNQT